MNAYVTVEYVGVVSAPRMARHETSRESALVIVTGIVGRGLLRRYTLLPRS